jgi:hypothetical protein
MKKQLVQIRLTAEQVAAAQSAGVGNLSAGIRVALDTVRDCQIAIDCVSSPADRLAMIERAIAAATPDARW